MMIVASKPFMLVAIMLSVIRLNVMAPKYTNGVEAFCKRPLSTGANPIKLFNIYLLF
jgi:hypothetical protein